MRPTMTWSGGCRRTPVGHPGRLAALALWLGLPGTLARVLLPSGPRRLRRSGRPMIPAQLASPSRRWLAAVWAVGLWVLRLARCWLGKSGCIDVLRGRSKGGVPWWRYPSRRGTAGSGSCFWPRTWWWRRCWWWRWSPCGREQPSGRVLRHRPLGWGGMPSRSCLEAPSQRRSCRPRPGPAWRRVSCGKGGGAPGRGAGGSLPPAVGGWSGRSIARALPSTVGAISSCRGPVLSRGSRCSALGSGDEASCRSPVAAEAA